MVDHVLTLNAGSSSIKFALFEAAAPWPRLLAEGQVQGLGAQPSFEAATVRGYPVKRAMVGENHAAGLQQILQWLREAYPEIAIKAVGHRVVHGGVSYAAPTIVDDRVLQELRDLEPLAPLHQPHNLTGIEAARAVFPSAPQVACFDTAFHRGHSFVNEAYALPREYYERGVRRFGFHGLSYEYIALRLREIDPVLACGRVIVAHLGNGASLCAMKDGRSVASTMGFTALEGLPMGTRCGEIDPGLLLYLLQHDKMSPEALSGLLYEQSGLKGLSGISQDMRALEASENPHARDAIAYFTHRIRMEIGALAAALEGLDALIFTAGIGEHSARVRANVLEGMGWLGLTLDPAANVRNDMRISVAQAKIPVFIVAANEEATIARHAIKTAGLNQIPTAA
ncbi:acetate/propionate family kinase [Methylocystis bryophila]|uniref:Acetate kinase n=1 Tax=Methylocystis bryophila TaxID=655015 RepID=A0A1W6MVT5_9HYPH|nr:acetate/propionate family kinase [Methylocystis bryophila]ARN81685.1 acetate kinase [Methylocystis bryophila]BDV37734.1 acetate kinase [Methylocystis bryophila]